jgi:hypothetical protein
VQPPTDGPRAGLTTAQVRYLMENAPSVEIDVGLELLEPADLSVAEDITGDLIGGSVSRSSYANIHGASAFNLSRQLDWGRSIVRPYYLMTGPLSATATTLTQVRFNLGAYYTSTPDDDLSEVPPTYQVVGYDILSVLDDAVGDAYAIPAGTDYLQRVEDILISRGVTRYIIDRTQAGVLVPSAKTYTLDDNVTWLIVVNDLLAAIGYQGIWSDWNGYLRVHSYTTPSARPPEWVHGVTDATTLIGTALKRSRDYYSAPNRWVFYRQNNTDSTAPVDGNGRYEFINSSLGDTSVDARGGRIKSKVVGVDAADQPSLVAAAQVTIDADRMIPTTFAFETWPFPLAWHFDKYTLMDPRVGRVCDVLGSSWTLPFDGSNQQHEMTVVY